MIKKKKKNIKKKKKKNKKKNIIKEIYKTKIAIINKKKKIKE